MLNIETVKRSKLLKQKKVYRVLNLVYTSFYTYVLRLYDEHGEKLIHESPHFFKFDNALKIYNKIVAGKKDITDYG